VNLPNVAAEEAARPHTVSDQSVDNDALIISGWISKKGSLVKTWKTRYFVMSKGWISYYAKGPPHVSDRKGQMPLDGVEVIVRDDAGCCLIVKSVMLKRELWLRFDNMEVREDWRGALEAETSSIGSLPDSKK
jgi:hypothetical protein